MSGNPGTPRFGEYADEHVQKTDSFGDSVIQLQNDNRFTEVHFLYNPAQQGREMGTTLGDAPGKYFEKETRGIDYMANHDGFFGGDAHLTNLDERKILDNKIMSVKVECADDFQHNWNSTERTA